MPPPVGLNLYVASGITKMGITELTIAVWPWLLSMLCFLGLVTYWPHPVPVAAPHPWACCSKESPLAFELARVRETAARFFFAHFLQCFYTARASMVPMIPASSC